MIVPDGWRCCAFAGDRGLLHEELTATATHEEAAQASAWDAELYLSLNRTCELGMTRATGRTYVHVLEELASLSGRAVCANHLPLTPAILRVPSARQTASRSPRATARSAASASVRCLVYVAIKANESGASKRLGGERVF